MRNYSPSYESDYGPYNEPRSTFDSFDTVRTLALVGAVALIAAPAITTLLRRWRSRQELAATEPAVDKTIKDSYPASDPPASRYFDIPENRR
jgi:hypothetical protein